MFKKFFRKLHGIKSKGKMLVYKYTENGVGKTQKKKRIFFFIIVLFIQKYLLPCVLPVY